MRRLAKLLAVLMVMGAASSTAFIGVRSARAMALSPCYYDEHTDTSWFNHLSWDSNYMNVTLSIWEVDSLGCTGWAGHQFGDVEVEIEANLGTTQDYFVNALNPIAMFGCTPCGVTHPAYGYNGPWNKLNPYYGPGATWVNGMVWGLGSPAVIGGTDGDTTIYENSTFYNASCASGGINAVWLGDGSRTNPNFWPSEVDISGNPVYLPTMSMVAKAVGLGECDE